MKHKNEIQVYLAVYGENFNPDELTALLQVTPTHTHIKGQEAPPIKGLYQKPGTKPPVYKETAWEYGSDYVKTYDSEDASRVVETALKDKVALINQFVSKHNLSILLWVVPWLAKRERPRPRIHFSPTFIKMLSDLNAAIDMDIYVV